MAEIKIDGGLLAQMLFPSVECVRVTSARNDDLTPALVLTIEGPDVPEADQVAAVFTLRATRNQRFIECRLEPLPIDPEYAAALDEQTHILEVIRGEPL